MRTTALPTYFGLEIHWSSRALSIGGQLSFAGSAPIRHPSLHWQGSPKHWLRRSPPSGSNCCSSFGVRDVESQREHYALTLRHWARRLELHRGQVLAAVSEPTYRVWRLFLRGSIYGFASGALNLYGGVAIRDKRFSAPSVIRSSCFVREGSVRSPREPCVSLEGIRFASGPRPNRGSNARH
jgi:hypothetical protein